MGLENKLTASLVEADLIELITNARSEGKTLEFKKKLFGGSDDDKREFLADVSSFANTIGGHIIFGMEEIQGVASALPGISDLDADSEILRIESILRDSIAPRIIGISTRCIRLNNSNHAIVIHIPHSWTAPPYGDL